ncbi:esterase [Nonlabens sp. SCSIO 43208]
MAIIIMGCMALILSSCTSQKSTAYSESKYFTDSIYSNSLNEYRKHNIYLPKGFSSSKKYPIIYSTDGSKISKNSFYKRTLDSLINNQIIKPIIFVSSHSNKKVADSSGTLGNGDKMYLTYRYFEYVEKQFIEGSHNPQLSSRFTNHLNYFNFELIPSVEKDLNQNLTKNDRYFYGVSNGAGFGMSMLNKEPNTIGTYICFSIFGGNIQSNIWNENVKYPILYSEYGSDEPFFLKEDAEFLKTKYDELDLDAFINEYNGGHDYKIWNKKFIEIVAKILAK